MKIRHVCGLLAILMLCVLLTPFPARADEDTLEWVEIGKPGLSGKIVVSPSEVSEIAVGRGGTIYATDNVNDVVYQSLNGGQTWEDITSRLVDAGAGLPVRKIAIAPDTTGTVAVVTDSGTTEEVYVSTDGGDTWTGTNAPGVAGTIQSIAISRQYTEAGVSLRDIAIGTAAWGNNTTTGEVWVFQLGKSVPSWQDQSLTVDQINPGGEVSSIAYSPNYPRDKTIIVVASTSTGSDVDSAYRDKTWLCMGKRNTSAGTTAWGYFIGYPREIGTTSSPSAGDDSGVTRISSSLALPSSYSGSNDESRRLFVSYDRDPDATDANDDVYRFNDTTVYRLNADGGTAIDIRSIAYYGMTTTSGKLLAGDVSPVSGSPTIRVRRTSNPFDSAPTWHLASVPPSGPGNAKVSWSSDGNSAYCGTSSDSGATLDESAFSMSSDDGDNWQQLSLMDTTINLADIAPAPDSETLFVATYSSLGPEGIWRSATTQPGIGEYWSRQMTMNTSSDNIILRLSPDYASDYTIYAAEAGGNLMAMSHNRGNSWKRRIGPGELVDMVVEDKNTLYAALPGGYVSKSTNGAFTWEEPVSTGLNEINMLAIAEKGTVLVGGRNGEVAYSTDGGASFTRINKAIGTSDVQVVADAGYEENGIIYAATNASDRGIWRWTIAVSTGWQQIDESITSKETKQRISGLAMSSEGTLYALRMESADDNSGGMTRSLNPAARNDGEIEFVFTNAGLPAGTAFNPTKVFPNTLPYLKISGDSGQNELWAVDTANELIYRFQDTLSKTGADTAISVLGPADRFSNQVNSVTGKADEIPFVWSRLSSATKYSLEIAYDHNFSEMVTTANVSSSLPTVSVAVGPDRTGAQQVNWLPGKTYYWRVRAIAPVSSSYSAARTIIIEPAAALVPALLSPVNGDISVSRTPSFSWEPVAGATEYRFILADNAAMSSPVVDAEVRSTGYALDRELDEGKTYFWKVRAVVPVEWGWSTIANFTVKEKPVEAPPPVAVKEISPPVINIPEQSPPPQEIVIPPYPPPPAAIAPAYVWAIIIIAAILMIAVLVLIIRTRRPA